MDVKIFNVAKACAAKSGIKRREKKEGQRGSYIGGVTSSWQRLACNPRGTSSKSISKRFQAERRTVNSVIIAPRIIREI